MNEWGTSKRQINVPFEAYDEDNRCEWEPVAKPCEEGFAGHVRYHRLLTPNARGAEVISAPYDAALQTLAASQQTEETKAAIEATKNAKIAALRPFQRDAKAVSCLNFKLDAFKAKRHVGPGLLSKPGNAILRFAKEAIDNSRDMFRGIAEAVAKGDLTVAKWPKTGVPEQGAIRHVVASTLFAENGFAAPPRHGGRPQQRAPASSASSLAEVEMEMLSLRSS